MQPIQAADYSIVFNTTGYEYLNTHIKEGEYTQLYIIVDTNTHEHCLSYFLSHIETELAIEVIEIEASEIYKTIDTCTGVWNALSELDADRKSLMLNLGGGVVTDLGGFVASTYKRGITYINIPTSLLAMVDASVGGKTGVDLGVIKNQIGVINVGAMVLIDTQFLNTLPQNQMRSGLAEMLKHGLIYDEAYWQQMTNLKALTLDDLDALIHRSVVIKNNIVTEDPLENGLRKTLNYGHTLGHAIESYFLSHPEKDDLLHGEAIAIGMVLATYISHKLLDFPEDKMHAIKAAILNTYNKVTFEDSDLEPIIELLKFDKKNSYGNINFVLLEDISKTKIDCQVSNELILDSFKYYAS